MSRTMSGQTCLSLYPSRGAAGLTTMYLFARDLGFMSHLAIN